MIQRLALTLAAVFFSAASLLHAQAPAGSTGQCKDGTYSTAASKSGACRGHQGVQTWFAASATPAKSAAAKSATATAAPKTAAPAAAVKPAAMPATASGAAPSGASGQCNDGTYSNAASKSGACRGHQGVKTWFAASAAPAAKSSPAPAAAAAPAPRPAPAPAPRPAPAAAAAPAPQPAPAQPARTQPAAGGGNGQVWVNTATKVYHCSNDRYYGKTKQGAYMSQGDAQAKGYRPDAGNVCPN